MENARRIDLDDVAAMNAVDAAGMIEITLGFSDQFRHGFDLGAAFTPPPLPDRPHEVVVLATGGSSAGARLLQSLVFDRCPVPLRVIQSEQLPGWLDRQSAVIVISYSGNTPEVLAAFRQARERGVTAWALGSGGQLQAAAAEWQVPFLAIPSGIMPRAALGYLMMPVLACLGQWRLIPDPGPELAEALTEMAGWRAAFGPAAPLAHNRAKQLALALCGRLPLVYGSAGYLDGAARRLKTQLGENSKCLAAWNVLPHLHHDEAVGWEMEPHLLRQVGLVLLRDGEESAWSARRWAATREMCAGRMGTVTEAWSRGRGRLARLMSLVGLGDLASCYLAVHRGVDPTPVPMIRTLQSRLGRPDPGPVATESSGSG